MLDTAVWKSFCGENAEYAIGGPSIELFLKSYNEKYSTNYVVSAYNTGYLAGPGYAPDSSEWTGIYNVGGDPNECFALEYHDELYCVSNEDKTKAMWVASPAFGAGYTSHYDGLMRITGTDYLSIAGPSGTKANWEVVARDGIQTSRLSEIFSMFNK